MSDEYANLGTVRRRARTDHQRTAPEFEPNGKADGASTNGHGSYKRNGARADAGDDEREPRSRRQYENRENRRHKRDRDRDDRDEKRERPLPWREIAAEAPLFRCPFDPWRLFGAVKRKALYIAGTALVLMVIGFFVGIAVIPYTMSLPLIRKTSNMVRSDSALPSQFLPYEYSDGTLYAFMKNGDVIRRVLDKVTANPALASLHLDGEQLAKSISVVPLANPDWVYLKLKTFGDLGSMASVINIYGQEAVDYMVEVQRRESSKVYAHLTNLLSHAEENIQAIQADKQKLSDSGYFSFDRESEDTIADLRKMRELLVEKELQRGSIDDQLKELDREMPNSRVLTAKAELQEMLLTKKPAHPEVQLKMAEIKQLEQQQNSGQLVRGAGASNGSSDPVAGKRLDLSVLKPKLDGEIKELSARYSQATNQLYQRKDKSVFYAVKQAAYDSAIRERDELAKGAREAELYAKASLGYFSIPEPATEKSIDKSRRWLKVAVMAFGFALLGIFISAGMALVGEALDTTLKTSEDIMRVCKLPVLATLGDLQKLSAKQQVDWAFRTLTLLKGKLNRNPDQALVCGIISANHGEGRSTWVNLLVNASSQRGLRVLTVDTRPASAAPASTPPPPKPEPVKTETAEKNGHSINLPDEPALPVAKDALNSPEIVKERFEGPSPQALVHIPLPGWVWSLERRKQWHNALDHWKHIDNLVIFVELPPACESESVLLAENLPQVIWLVGSGMADAAETAAHLETLRHAHCNLVGAVLNHAPPPFLNSKIGRWLNPVTAIALLASSLCFNSLAAESELQSAQTTVTAQPAVMQSALSANAKRQRAKWQEHLTLGPGDIIDIHFYGNPSLSRTNVFIGPDGRINYLQATGVSAAGLSIEELRKKLDDELATYYPAARTIVLPASFASKKYYMLGKINVKGSFNLDRPLTLIEAVAKAKGLETGLYQRTTVELADLGHSFIVRDGKKLSVNFEKLFLEGDLSQNVPIEPNDYIYFASTAARDIYVIGEVMNPGPLGFVNSASVLTAITDRGGFTPTAFKRRVLVVRGSLNEPETFVINTDAALDGHLRDFRLQPRDIVYVSRRPWSKVEELGDEFIQSFIQGAVTAWAGENIGPVITGRLFPRLNK